MKWCQLPCTLYLIGMALHAQAGLVMIVDDPSTQEIEHRITDGGDGDSQPIPGVIGFSGIVGGVQLDTTGESKGAVGSISAPQLILHLDPATRLGPGSTGGTVDILLTDTDFDADLARGIASIDVTGVGGQFEFSLFGDSSNREFGEGFEITSTCGPVSSGFDRTLGGAAQPIGSLTINSRVGFTSTTEVAGAGAELTLDGVAFRAWQNLDWAIDVDMSSSVEPLDALRVIDSLNEIGSRLLPDSPGCDDGPPPFYDTSGDGFVSPIDALLVINFLNEQPQAAVAADSVRALAIPEPGGAGLLLLGSLILFQRRASAARDVRSCVVDGV